MEQENLQSLLREPDQAIAAGETAHRQARQVLSTLRSAAGKTNAKTASFRSFFVFFAVDSTGNGCYNIRRQLNSPYQERRRERPDDARQPAHGVRC